jgi:hypothetical protein
MYFKNLAQSKIEAKFKETKRQSSIRMTKPRLPILFFESFRGPTPPIISSTYDSNSSSL